MEHFRSWSDRAGIPWRAIKPHLDDVVDKAKTLWQEAMKDLPMNEAHKKILKAHWGNLHEDFRIK
jgi:serine/threonine-protein kinase HipA